MHFDPSKQCHLKTNSSDYVSAEILSQEDNNRILHPVAYFSKRMVPTECNYKIDNKELFAIIQCFEEWRPELEGTAMPVKMLTDHKGVEYFMTTKKLTLRQARWAEFLSKFNFVITYQSGKKNDKANALTRRPNKQLISNEDNREKHRMRVLLPPEQIEIQPVKVTNKSKVNHNDHANATRDKSVEVDHDKLEESKELGRLHATEPHAKPKKSIEEDEKSDEELTEDKPSLPNRVKEANQRDALFMEVREYLANSVDQDRPTVYLRDSRAANGLLYKDNKLWVNNDLRLDVI